MTDHDKPDRGRTYASRSTATLALAVGAIVLANLVATRAFRRVDLTEDHVYTLSAASAALVRSLPDPLTIKAYVSKDLPPELAPVSRYVRDFLDEYREASGGKLRFQLEDPAASKTAADDAERCRVGTVPVQVRRGQKAELGQYYLGLCLWYDGKSRALNQIGQTADFEYRVTSLIKLMSQRRRKVAFTAGHGERDLGDTFSFVKMGVGDEVDVVTLNPSVAPITDDVDALVVAGPRQPFDDRARREVDAFLMKGRGALLLLDGAAPAPLPGGGSDVARRIARPVETGLEEPLAAYGFAVGRDLVFDRGSIPGPIDTGAGDKLVAALPAFVPVATEPAPLADHTILAGVQLVVFPFASPVELRGPLAAGPPPGAHLYPLARTSPASWRSAGPFTLSPGAATGDAAAARGPFTLAYAYQGVLPSAYPETGRASSAKPVRLVVVGDSDFATDDYVRMVRAFPAWSGGPQMLFNAVSWVLEDEALTPLRANVLRSRVLALGAEDRAAAVRWGNAVGVPFAFCAAGVLRWRLRQASRRRQRLVGGGGESGGGA
jgi:ABC-type uncharacterized transport system involved in gliding motility auxiliary subunit